jgi:hypothetical protein
VREEDVSDRRLAELDSQVTPHVLTESAEVTMLLDQANAVLARNFEVDPCFRIMVDGTAMVGVDKDLKPIPGC